LVVAYFLGYPRSLFS